MGARTQAAVALVLALAPAAFAAEGVTFHVSPAGDDSWSGRSAVPNPGRTDGRSDSGHVSAGPRRGAASGWYNQHHRHRVLSRL